MEKSPRVIMVKGKEINCKNGLRKVLMILITKAAAKADDKPVIWMPGIIKVVVTNDKSERKNKPTFDIELDYNGKRWF